MTEIEIVRVLSKLANIEVALNLLALAVLFGAMIVRGGITRMSALYDVTGGNNVQAGRPADGRDMHKLPAEPKDD